MQNQARMLMECKHNKSYNSISKNWKKIKDNVKNDDFWPYLLEIMTLPCMDTWLAYQNFRKG